MNKFIAFSIFSGVPALITYKAVDFLCGHIYDACSGNIRPAQICCTICVWFLSVMFFYALWDEFEKAHLV